MGLTRRFASIEPRKKQKNRKKSHGECSPPEEADFYHLKFLWVKFSLQGAIVHSEVWFNPHRTKGSTNLWFELAARRLIGRGEIIPPDPALKAGLASRRVFVGMRNCPPEFFPVFTGVLGQIEKCAALQPAGRFIAFVFMKFHKHLQYFVICCKHLSNSPRFFKNNDKSNKKC
jgi:hypothetical protein